MIKKIFLGVVAIIFILIVIVVLYVLSISAARPEPAPAVNSSLYQAAFQSAGTEADNWLRSMYANNQLPSMSAAIGINGDLVWAGTTGYADLYKKIPATTDTRYRIGSISKSVTAAAVMRMSEKGILDINNSFNTYVKDFSPANTGYTIKHLLSHQAGIRHYTKGFSENYNTSEYASTRAAALIVENDALLFAPGTGFNYSTYGYNLLALAMESAASLSLEEIITREVFAPAGMNATQFDKAGSSAVAHRAEPYLLIGDSLFEAPASNLSDRYAGGGYLSTPTDLVKFGNALIGNNFLTDESKAALWTPVPLADGAMNPEHYALGFRVGQDDLGRFVHHGGMSIGGYSFLIIYPDLGIVMAFVSNVTPMESSFDRLDEAKKVVRFFRPSL
ncbi:MAG: serine hydrolase domain-containing protein [Cellvibrio sp.]|uniref:serine hydrolase domain-containing protein n=1 Tax=Cellvibrio sp. TaxID=1965322 RepID=UPI0031A0A7D2